MEQKVKKAKEVLTDGRSTKAQFKAALQDVVDNFNQREVLPAADRQEREKTQLVTAAGNAAETVLNGDTTKSLTEFAALLNTTAESYKAITAGIAAKQLELKDLTGVELKADMLAGLKLKIAEEEEAAEKRQHELRLAIGDLTTVYEREKAEYAAELDRELSQSRNEQFFDMEQQEGSASDPDGDAVTYLWTAPDGITLSDATIATPTFTAPELDADADYTFSLVVNDGTVDSDVDEVVITVKDVPNQAPVANAGADQTVNEATEVTLNGTASDPDGDAITYLWTAPDGITLSDATKATPTFTAPELDADTDYTFTLVVNDGTVDSAADEVVITVKDVPNQAPVANAGADQTVDDNITVTLDGSASNDPDGDNLTYLWTAPDGITLSDATVVNPTFTSLDVLTNTDYTFSLVVNDGTEDSNVDEVVITVQNVTGIEEFSRGKISIYPNPASVMCTINFELLNAGYCEISILNIVGQELEKVAARKMSSGEHIVYWNVKDTSPGLYFVKIRRNENIDTYKIVIK
jgi:hypothetical protein